MSKPAVKPWKGKKYVVEFSLFADPIAKQLRRQRVRFDAKAASHWERDADAILRLKIRGMLTEHEGQCARKRLFRSIASSIRGKPIKSGFKTRRASASE